MTWRQQLTNKGEYRALVESQGQVETKVIEETHVPMPFFPTQFSH